jgi:5'-nucleotidase
MKRRDFVRNSFLVTGGLVVSSKLLSQESNRDAKKVARLTILHTNDTHSNIDPFPANHSKYPNMGGVSKRYSLINKVREEEDHVLLLDAGDIFQGTPYFNKYGGVLEMKLMTEMGYDVATMGNHDFDAGLEGFLKAKQYAKFPFVCANYDFSKTILNEQTVPHVILKKGKIKVGIFGIGVELKGLVPDSKFGDTIYLDPIKTANTQAELLKKKGCDLIICLSHLGYEYADDKISDRRLARETKNIHLILGGHTHTFLEKPTEEKNLDGQTVLINQVGWAGLQVGRLDFEVDSNCFAKKDIIEIK